MQTWAKQRVVFVGVAVGNPHMKCAMPGKVQLGGAGVPTAGPQVLTVTLQSHFHSCQSRDMSPVTTRSHFAFPCLIFSAINVGTIPVYPIYPRILQGSKQERAWATLPAAGGAGASQEGWAWLVLPPPLGYGPRHEGAGLMGGVERLE